MTDCTITALSETRDRDGFQKAFSALPERIGRGGGPIGSPLPGMWERLLSFRTRGGSDFWIARKNARTVGRIGSSLLSSRPGTGVVGFFEVDLSIPDPLNVASGLLDTAERWLREKGIIRVVGPMNFNTWFSYRFRTDLDREVFAWEPGNPEEYPKIFTDLGFRVCREYHSIASAGLERYVVKTESDYVECRSRGFTFRPFSRTHFVAREIPILFEISMAGFKDNFLFEPISFEAFRGLYVPIAEALDLSYCFFTLNPDGEEVGFIFCFLDKDYLILKSMTVLPDYRGLGLSNALTHVAGRLASKKGFLKFVSALVRKGAQSESYSRKAETLWIHRYSLYEKYLRAGE